ncbi:transposase [Thermosynechococcus sp.]|uniref:transposase n=1 Tax=Thermosynechococcus sp. TaxID=2814275 RepID=UPI0037DC70A4
MAKNWTPLPPNGRGRSRLYSDWAIQFCLMIKILSRPPYRAAEGLVNSLMRLCGLNLPVLNHAHLSRQAATLEVKIPHRWRTGAIHVVVDSIGLKIFRESEW